MLYQNIKFIDTTQQIFDIIYVQHMYCELSSDIVIITKVDAVTAERKFSRFVPARSR
jgi:hypothetical protein